MELARPVSSNICLYETRNGVVVYRVYENESRPCDDLSPPHAQERRMDAGRGGERDRERERRTPESREVESREPSSPRLRGPHGRSCTLGAGAERPSRATQHTAAHGGGGGGGERCEVRGDSKCVTPVRDAPAAALTRRWARARFRRGVGARRAAPRPTGRAPRTPSPGRPESLKEERNPASGRQPR